MHRNRRRWSLALTVLVAAAASEGLSDARGDSDRVCPLDVVGIWKPEVTEEANPILLSFSPDGWVSLLSGSAETRAEDFEVTAQVGYRLEASTEATRIEFTTARGTDVFPPGTSSWEIVDHGDDSFTRLNHEPQEQSRWVRVQTHRYFLTFAARSGGADRAGPALVMWTKLNGRRVDFDALGARRAKGVRGEETAVFGRIPQALAQQFAVERDNERGVMMRLELNEAEYHRTHTLFEAWERRARDGSLPPDDPYRRTLQFLEVIAGSLNQCGERLAPVEERDLSQQPGEFIRLMRRTNESRHVTDDRFPFVWEPPPTF